MAELQQKTGALLRRNGRFARNIASPFARELTYKFSRFPQCMYKLLSGHTINMQYAT